MLLPSASLCLLSAASLPLASASNDLIRMSLSKRYLKSPKYERAGSTCGASADKSLCIAFNPFNNGFYQANVTFTGNQTYPMLLDTSSDFWIYAVNSSTTNSSLSASGVLWDTSMSNGTVTNVQTGIVYADGAAANYTWWRELVYVGNLSVANAWVGASPFASSGYNTAEIAQEGFSGIIGLAYPALGSGYSQGVTPFVNNMVEAGVISEPVFGFYAASNQASNDSIAEITFGGYDQSHYTGNLTFYDVLPSFPAGYGPGSNDTMNSTMSGNVSASTDSSMFGFYAINVTSLTVGDNSTNLLNATTTYILDSGTSFLSVSNSAFKTLVDMFNGTVIANGTANAGIEGVEIDCSKVSSAPNLTFTIMGDKYTVPGSAWVQNDPTLSVTGVQCYLELYDAGTGANDTFGILGDTFFRNYYVAFNQSSNQVGLAPHS